MIKRKQRKREPPRFLRNLRAKLTFDDGYAENPIDKIIANVGEKNKGIMMLERIENRFNISDKDRREAIERTLAEMDSREKVAFTPTIIPEEIKKRQKEPPKWTRDERGNIVSPFKSRKWKESMSP